MKFMKRLALAATIAVGGIVNTTRAADPDPLLPADSEGVMFFNMRQLVDSDIIKKYALEKLKEGLESEDAQKQLKKFGVNPLKDIDKVTVGFWGKEGEEPKFGGTIRGKFDPAKLFEAVQEEAKKNPDKVSLVKSGKYTIIKATNENAQPNTPKEFFGAVADENTIVMASSEQFCVDLIKRAEEKVTKAALSKEVTALLVKMDDKATFYFCGLNKMKEAPKFPPQAGQVLDDPEKFAKTLVAMKDFSLVLRCNEDVGVEINMGMKDKDSQKDMDEMMSDLVGKVKAFLPLVSGSQPNMKAVSQELSKSMKVKSNESDVSITTKVSGKAIAAAVGKDD